MPTLLQDLRYGLRTLVKTPVVTGVALLSLALGIAANATIFAVLNAFLFEPLPYHDQDGLVLVGERRAGESVENFRGISIANLRDYEAAATTLDGVMAYSTGAANLTGLDVPERIRMVSATPNVLDVLGVQPALGRGFRADEGDEGRGRVLVLDHEFWMRRFLGDREVLGRTLTLDGVGHTVVGVMPEAFDLIPADVDVYRPTDFEARRDDRSTRGYVALGRLTAGATPERAREELLGVSTRLAAEHPDANRGFEASVQPIRDFFPGPTDQKLVMILTAVTLFGLLIACANVANLLLGRAEARQKEVAVRTALGAGRHRILRQLLTESVALAVAAGGVGVLLAVSVVRWLEGMMPAELPRAMIPELDPEVLVATLAVSVLAGIAFGLAPALHAARPDLRGALGDGSRGGTAGRSRKRLRNGFVVGEFAVALALLTGAAFLMQAFAELTRTDPGFRQDGLLTLSLGVSEDRYAEDADVVVYQDALLASLAAVPGVEGVAAMSTLPRGRSHPTASYTIEGREPPDAAEPPTAALQAVNADYFRTLEIDLLRGRGIEPSDRPETLPVAVVSQAFVDRELPAEDPLGRIVTVAGRERTIVGVVEDIIQERIPVAGESGEAIYLPLAQHPRRSLSFALRAAGDPGALAGDVRRAVWAVNPDQPVAQVRTLDDHVAESLTGPRALSWFVSAMGVIALLLAALGIYGVMSHAVQQQRKEIGIRMALGAGRGSVVGMVTRSGLGLAGVGMLLGLPLAWLMYRAVVSALGVFGSRPDPGWAVAVTVALGLVALVSTWLPARRASGVQPVVALGE